MNDDTEQLISLNLGQTSDIRLFLNMLKSIIGAGILASPYVAHRTGIAIAMPGFFILCALNCYQMSVLVHCYAHMCRLLELPYMELGDLVYLSFTNSKSRFKSMGRWARVSTNLMVFFSQFGSGSVYIIFMGSTVSQIINQFHPNNCSLSVYMGAVTGFLLVFIFIHDLKFLSNFSLFANICTVLGLSFVFYFSSVQISPFSTFKFVGDIKGFAIYMGSSLYSIEGVTLILPFYSDMKNKNNFMGLYSLCLSIYVVLTWALQILGTIKYGDKLCGLIALNLPVTDTLSLSTRAMFICGVFVSFGLQIYVLIRLIITQCHRSQLWSKVIYFCGDYKFETFVRFFISLLALTAAIVVPFLATMMSVFGAFCGFSLGLILPAVLELVVFAGDEKYFGRFRWKAVFNYFVIFVSVGLMGFVLYESGVEMVAAFNGHPSTPDSCRR